MFKSVFFSVSLLFVVCEVTTVPKGPSCPTLKLKYGRVRYRQKGRFVKFMCNTGYIIAGEKYSTCHSGAWDSPLPKCVRASCVKVNPPMNGLIYPSHRGAVLNFFCKPGFELRGPNTTYCDGHNWDSNLPACIASNTKPSLSCDFEAEDLCGWNQDLRHDFDWTRMNYKTPSGHLGTGPSYDHTKGEGQTGYYMYIESSSRNENDTARLISPIYDKMNDTDVCLEFFYHMHGASIGQLRIYLKKESDSWAMEPSKALFWKSGNHGDRWLRSISQIGPIDEDFQIIIEGVRGASYFSDIAVDDIKIIQNCTLQLDVTTESGLTYTDDLQTMPSCLNRCDDDNLIVPPDTFQFGCGCDETCTDNNTCCPDYITLCILGITDDTSTMDISTVTAYTSSSATDFTETLTTPAAAKPTKISKTSTLQQIPKKVHTYSINTNEVNAVLPESKNNSLAITAPTKYILANTTNFNRVPRPFVPQAKLPPLVFLTPTTPAVIVQRIRTSTTIKLATPAMQRASTLIPITLSVKKTRLPVTQKAFKQPSTQVPIDEILTVPNRSEEDYGPYFTSLGPHRKEKPAVITDYTRLAPIKKSTSDVLFSNFNLQNQKIVKEKSGTSTSFIVVVVASVSFILLVILSAVFLVRRYRFRGCGNRTMYSSSSNSQSDVRFLTSDEMLDFSLACPND